jgi:hypothetical protein
MQLFRYPWLPVTDYRSRSRLQSRNFQKYWPRSRAVTVTVTTVNHGGHAGHWCTHANKVYSTRIKKNVHSVLHASEKYRVYSVHVGFNFYTLFLSKIFSPVYIEKVCFLNLWIGLKLHKCCPIEKKGRGVDTSSMPTLSSLYRSSHRRPIWLWNNI